MLINVCLVKNFFHRIFSEEPIAINRLAGGDINDVYEVIISGGEYVVKVNDDEKFPGMLSKEAMGLAMLANAACINTPEVFNVGSIDGKQYLVLEKIRTRHAMEKTWERFGCELARLHQSTSENYGSDHDNYIGSLVQRNTPCQTWTDFLITQRLQPMLEMAVNQGEVNYVEAKVFDLVFKKLDSLIPPEKPSLIHGDLWSGNFLTGPSLEPVLIDPAAYYGHREMDLAMMHLFGGFSPKLFEIYNENFPLESGWKKRMGLNQLYPLLVHVNLFGRSYWEKVRSIVKKYD